MTISLIQLLVVLILIGLGLWAVEQLPLDGTIVRIIRVVAVFIAVLFVLAAFGLLPAGLRLV